MIVYEVRIQVDQDIEETWVDWMRKEHVSMLFETGYVRGFNLLKELKDDNGRPTYCFQYRFLSQDTLNAYFDEHAARLRAHVSDNFAGRFSAERKIYEEI